MEGNKKVFAPYIEASKKSARHRPFCTGPMLLININRSLKCHGQVSAGNEQPLLTHFERHSSSELPVRDTYILFPEHRHSPPSHLNFCVSRKKTHDLSSGFFKVYMGAPPCFIAIFTKGTTIVTA